MAWYLLLQTIDSKDQQIEKLIAENAELRRELQLQKDIVAALLKKLYGATSEKLSTDQLLLAFLEDESKKPHAAEPDDHGPAAEPTPKKPRARRSNKLSDSLANLPTTERVIIAPEVRDNPENYRLIGEEVSERLHVNPATFTRELIKRLTHVRKNDPEAVPVTLPLEPCLLPGSVLTPSLGALLLTEKFCYHQPFYRQEWRLKATHGIVLTRNLMCSWHDHLAGLLSRLYEYQAEKFRLSDYLQIDETPIRYLEPGSGKAQLGYLWAYHHHEHGVLFDWHASRANTCLDPILIGHNEEDSFNGYLQSDGLRAYQTFRDRHQDLEITPVSCLAHIRRKFTEAQGDHSKITAWIILQIGKIYRLEARLKNRRAGPELRKRARQILLRRIYRHLQELFKHLQKHHRILPKSALGKALKYAIDQWPHLEPCFEDGRIEWDNNLTENAIRPTKLGAKNWMFIGGKETGWRSAVIFTFVEQVRSHGHDPFAYFEWVFEKLMHNPPEDELEGLLPEAWIKTQRRDSAVQSGDAA